MLNLCKGKNKIKDVTDIVSLKIFDDESIDSVSGTCISSIKDITSKYSIIALKKIIEQKIPNVDIFPFDIRVPMNTLNNIAVSSYPTNYSSEFLNSIKYQLILSKCLSKCLLSFVYFKQNNLEKLLQIYNDIAHQINITSQLYIDIRDNFNNINYNEQLNMLVHLIRSKYNNIIDVNITSEIFKNEIMPPYLLCCLLTTKIFIELSNKNPTLKYDTHNIFDLKTNTQINITNMLNELKISTEHRTRNVESYLNFFPFMLMSEYHFSSTMYIFTIVQKNDDYMNLSVNSLNNYIDTLNILINSNNLMDDSFTSLTEYVKNYVTKSTKNQIFINILLSYISNDDLKTIGDNHSNSIVVRKKNNIINVYRLEPHRHSYIYCRNSIRKRIRDLFSGINNVTYHDHIFDSQIGLQIDEHIPDILGGLSGFCCSWTFYTSLLILLNPDKSIDDIGKYLQYLCQPESLSYEYVYNKIVKNITKQHIKSLCDEKHYIYDDNISPMMNLNNMIMTQHGMNEINIINNDIIQDIKLKPLFEHSIRNQYILPLINIIKKTPESLPLYNISFEYYSKIKKLNDKNISYSFLNIPLAHQKSHNYIIKKHKLLFICLIMIIYVLKLNDINVDMLNNSFLNFANKCKGMAGTVGVQRVGKSDSGLDPLSNAVVGKKKEKIIMTSRILSADEVKQIKFIQPLQQHQQVKLLDPHILRSKLYHMNMHQLRSRSQYSSCDMLHDPFQCKYQFNRVMAELNINLDKRISNILSMIDRNYDKYFNSSDVHVAVSSDKATVPALPLPPDFGSDVNNDDIMIDHHKITDDMMSHVDMCKIDEIKKIKYEELVNDMIKKLLVEHIVNSFKINVSGGSDSEFQKKYILHRQNFTHSNIF
jgi:hypothetical protein